jgi:putative ABC transport system permease protein
MWRNYLTVGLRSLARNRVYAFINIFGLAIGLAACLLIFLYVRYETGFDRWLPDSDRVFQVQTLHTDPETGARDVQQGTEGVAAESLAKDFPQIEAIARVEGDRPVFVEGGEASFADLLRADPNFFSILQLPFLRGSAANALKEADSLVVSRSEALKRFGTIDAVGRTVTAIRRGEKYDMRVTGVFEDIRPNSHLGFKLVARIRDVDVEGCGWGCLNGFIYLKLRPGASAEAINAQLPAWEKRNIPSANINGVIVGEGKDFDWKLVNVRDVHLSGAEAGWNDRPGNDRTSITTFAIVALLILTMACVNFVNLTTARASQRAREVALRKVLGASRSQLVTQFLGESFLLTGIALLIGLALAELVLPWLSAYLGLDLHMAYAGEDGVILPALLLWLVVGLAGGVYPALHLSHFRPAAILKANKAASEAAGTGRLRNALVVGQFAISIGLIICTAIVYSQTSFARTSDPGYRRQGLIQVPNFNRAAVVPVGETMMREVEKIPGVVSASAADIRVATQQVLNVRVESPKRTSPVTIGWYGTSPDFLETMGIRLLAGRPLSSQRAADRAEIPLDSKEAKEAAIRALVQRGLNVVVNALAAKQMGFATPAEAIGQQVRTNAYPAAFGRLPVTIVGIVQDSRFRSLRDPVEPMIFYDPGFYSTMILRYDSGEPEQLRQAVGRVWKRIAPDVPYEGQFADAELAELYAGDQARGATFAGFALLAIVVACLGLFGLAAFTAERRTKEIGIRKVFGARVRDIVHLLAWQFSKPVMIANLIAWPVAWWVMRGWLNGFDARIALGPGPFLLAGLLALMVAIGTISGHAIRVARLNPIHALRYE